MQEVETHYGLRCITIITLSELIAAFETGVTPPAAGGADLLPAMARLRLSSSMRCAPTGSDTESSRISRTIRAVGLHCRVSEGGRREVCLELQLQPLARPGRGEENGQRSRHRL